MENKIILIIIISIFSTALSLGCTEKDISSPDINDVSVREFQWTSIGSDINEQTTVGFEMIVETTRNDLRFIIYDENGNLITTDKLSSGDNIINYFGIEYKSPPFRNTIILAWGKNQADLNSKDTVTKKMVLPLQEIKLDISPSPLYVKYDESATVTITNKGNIPVWLNGFKIKESGKRSGGSDGKLYPGDSSQGYIHSYGYNKGDVLTAESYIGGIPEPVATFTVIVQ